MAKSTVNKKKKKAPAEGIVHIRATFNNTIINITDNKSFFLLAEPKHLEELIPAKNKNWVAIDEIQRIPELLNVVHSLI